MAFAQSVQRDVVKRLKTLTYAARFMKNILFGDPTSEFASILLNLVDDSTSHSIDLNENEPFLSRNDQHEHQNAVINDFNLSGAENRLDEDVFTSQNYQHVTHDEAEDEQDYDGAFSSRDDQHVTHDDTENETVNESLLHPNDHHVSHDSVRADLISFEIEDELHNRTFSQNDQHIPHDHVIIDLHRIEIEDEAYAGPSSQSDPLVSCPAVMVNLNGSEIEAQIQESNSPSSVWTYLCLGIFLEVLAAVFEQLSSTKKPQYALFALLFSIVGLALCIIDFVHKIWKGRVKLRRWNNIYWLFHPPNYVKPFGSFIDIVGLTYAISQSLTSIIQYVYFSRHANNPLKISLLPLIFFFAVVCKRLSKNCHRERASS